MEKEYIAVVNPAGVLSQSIEFEMKDKGLSFKEALLEAQKQFPEMARAYLLQIHGLWPPRDAVGMEGNPGDSLNELIKVKLKEKKSLSYGMAFSEVQRENPELAKRFLDQVRAKR